MLSLRSLGLRLSKHRILLSASFVGLALIIGLLLYGTFFQHNAIQSPIQLVITDASLSQLGNGTVTSMVAVRNSGTQTVSVTGRFDSFLIPPLSFTPSSIAPGEVSTGVASASWTVAQFDGTGGYMTVANSASLNPSAFTLEMGFRYNSFSPDQQMITGKGSAGADSFYFYSYRSANNINDFVLYNNNTRYDHSLGDMFVLGKWYDVAFVVDGTEIIAYVNGQVSYKWLDPVTFGGNSQNLTIGKCSCGGYFFNGDVAFERVYSRALSSTEVLQNYDSPTPLTAGLVMWLSPGHTAGNMVADQSGASNNATVYGPITFLPPTIPCDTYLLTLVATNADNAQDSISSGLRLNC